MDVMKGSKNSGNRIFC